MKKGILPADQQKLPPGVGIAGKVICPFLSLQRPCECVKEKCEMWVALNYDKKQVGRCSFGWLAVLSTEVRAAIEKIAQARG
jgi:hypothetical protein